MSLSSIIGQASRGADLYFVFQVSPSSHYEV